MSQYRFGVGRRIGFRRHVRSEAERQQSLALVRQFVANDRARDVVRFRGLGLTPPPIGTALPANTDTMQLPVAGKLVVVNMIQLAETAADAAAEIMAIIADPCLLIDLAGDAGQAALDERVLEHVEAAVNKMFEELDGFAAFGDAFDVSAYKDCVARAKGAGDKSCTDAGVATFKWVSKAGSLLGSGDYAGTIKALLAGVAKSIVQIITAKLMNRLGDVVKTALRAVVNRLGADCPSGGGSGGGAGGSGGASTSDGQSAPIIGGHAFVDTYVDPRVAANQVPSDVQQKPPPPPPPLLIFADKPTLWGTYLLWGGTGLVVGLVASRVLTGAWVPPVVRRKAAPVAAKIKRLRR